MPLSNSEFYHWVEFTDQKKKRNIKKNISQGEFNKKKQLYYRKQMASVIKAGKLSAVSPACYLCFYKLVEKNPLHFT